jgi:hypothetical protein
MEEENKLTYLELVKAEREALEKANAETRELIKKQEDLIARQIIGGQTDAGKQPAQPKEETPAEYAKRISQGRV